MGHVNSKEAHRCARVDLAATFLGEEGLSESEPFLWRRRLLQGRMVVGWHLATSSSAGGLSKYLSAERDLLLEAAMAAQLRSSDPLNCEHHLAV